ncbi:hypothetical protein IGI04_006269 [Brassica rapa subsp. trilocularis]|uniref:Uncharacterized protein n=1 Tax=Brassica rapa subsp. trilocularis TaxID=1813537 RepID=A0ABQ7NG49_BRACM|nr:hypothetical protein IGI04_006153 [Brassica rapa subsp. trilocularis]KAG5409950.1 hypothetical protein IGI04_006269 [Brassica rapa subsp. trilocularis]
MVLHRKTEEATMATKKLKELLESRKSSVKKCNGDTLEYQKLVKEDLRPALADIVFVWQSNKDDELVPASHRETVVNCFLQ